MDDTDARIYQLPLADVIVEDEPSPSTDLAPWEAPQSVVGRRKLPTRDVAREWLDDCRGGIEYHLDVGLYHLTHSWLYAGRFSRSAHRGVARLAVAWWSWVRDHASYERIDDLKRDVTVNAAATSTKIEDVLLARKQRVKWRWIWTGILTLAATVGCWWAIHHHPWWSLLAVPVTTVLLGMLGAGRGQVIDQFEVASPEEPLTIDLLIEAFIEAKITKPDRPVTVSSPPYDAGRGWVAQVKLPGGVTFDHVLGAQVELASGLDRPRDCLDLDGLMTKSERLIEVFVAHQHPMEVQIPQWPLLMVDRWDIWRPVPVGWDVRGNEVHLSLMWVMTLIGAAMQRGKTTLMRLLALAALLDPRADVIIVDFKGGADWKPYEKFCRRFLHGPRQVVAFSDLLDELDAEYERRMAAISRMPLADVPQGRVTPAMAETKAFRPIVVFVDEMQIATEWGGDPDDKDTKLDGKKIAKKWAELQKVCPAAGIVFVEATQKPDETSVPTFLRDAALQRVSLSVATRHASVAILGDEAYKVGLNAAALGGMPGYGISWAQDSDAGPGYRGRLRIPNCTPEMAAVMLERVARIRASVTVESVEDIPRQRARETPRIIAEVLRVWPHPEVAAHQSQLAAALDMKQADLSMQLRDAGLRAERQVKVAGINQSGYYLAKVQALADGHAS